MLFGAAKLVERPLDSANKQKRYIAERLNIKPDDEEFWTNWQRTNEQLFGSLVVKNSDGVGRLRQFFHDVVLWLT